MKELEEKEEKALHGTANEPQEGFAKRDNQSGIA